MRQAVDVLGIVFVNGEEERMTRRTAICIAETIKELRVSAGPAFHPLPRDVRAGPAVHRFIMVGDAEQHMNRFSRLRRAASARLHHVRAEPAVHRSPLQHPSERAQQRKQCEQDCKRTSLRIMAWRRRRAQCQTQRRFRPRRRRRSWQHLAFGRRGRESQRRCSAPGRRARRLH